MAFKKRKTTRTSTKRRTKARKTSGSSKKVFTLARALKLAKSAEQRAVKKIRALIRQYTKSRKTQARKHATAIKKLRNEISSLKRQLASKSSHKRTRATRRKVVHLHAYRRAA